MEGRARERTHEWRFRIGDAFPADNPLARFIVAVARAMDDGVLVTGLFVKSEQSYEHLYFFNLASSHLYEAARRFDKAHREWDDVRDFVASLDSERQEEFSRITALAGQNPAWPGLRLKELRDSFFHYLRLDRAAAEANQLPLQRALTDAADMDASLVIEAGGPLNGIRALFADEVFVKYLTADYEEGEFERLVSSLANHQADLNRFAQGAVGRYLRDLPDGIVEFEGVDEQVARDERADAERELYRLAFAQRDFKSAHELASALLNDNPLEYIDVDIYLALLAITYWRPFTNQAVGRLGSEWQTFPKNDRHEPAHRFLKTHRNKEYAHTDITPLKSVHVFPPGAWGDEGAVTTGRSIGVARETLEEIQDLCRYQHERATKRAGELVRALYGDREWPQGAMFELEHPDKPNIRTIQAPGAPPRPGLVQSEDAT